MEVEVVEEDEEERDREVKRLQAPDAETLDKAIMAGSSLLSTAFPRQYSRFQCLVMAEWDSAVERRKWGERSAIKQGGGRNRALQARHKAMVQRVGVRRSGGGQDSSGGE